MKYWEIRISPADNNKVGVEIEFQTANSATNYEVRRHFDGYAKVFLSKTFRNPVVTSVVMSREDELPLERGAAA